MRSVAMRSMKRFQKGTVTSFIFSFHSGYHFYPVGHRKDFKKVKTNRSFESKRYHANSTNTRLISNSGAE
jgi:hypothetical protein